MFDAVHDVSGQIVMAGAIDIHSHIAGGNVNSARSCCRIRFCRGRETIPLLPLGKCINAGGSAAFKSNVRTFGLDDKVQGYGVSSRRILEAMHRAVVALKIPHPLHVHCNNLGVPNSIEMVLATMDAAEGAPMHFAHVQFYSYGNEGALGFSSASDRSIEGMRRHPKHIG